MSMDRRVLSKRSIASARGNTGCDTGREVKFARTPLAKVSADGVFEGYASLFHVVDLGRDEVMAGAFRQSLSRKSPQAIKLLWQHDPAHPLGVWQEIAEDHRGLKVRGKLDLSVAKAREVHALMTSGAVDGLSIGFKTERALQNRQTGVRQLQQLDLWEISVVTFPMLPGARIASVKRMRSGPGRNHESYAGVLAEASLAQAMRKAARQLSA